MESVIVLALVTIFLVGQWLMLRDIASKDRAAREALARYGDDIRSDHDRLAGEGPRSRASSSRRAPLIRRSPGGRSG